MKAARALSLYDARYFTPRTPKLPAQPDKSNAPQQTSRSPERSSQRRG
jgi:hypothetical protein